VPGWSPEKHQKGKRSPTVQKARRPGDRARERRREKRSSKRKQIAASKGVGRNLCSEETASLERERKRRKKGASGVEGEEGFVRNERKTEPARVGAGE